MTTRILVLGATSAIAQAYARRRAAQGCAFIIAARREDRLLAIAADLKACGAASAEPFVADLAAIEAIEGNLRDIGTRFGAPDEVVIAYGVLGEHEAAQQDLAQARALIDSNFTSAALWVLALLKQKPEGAPLTIVGIGSVAGDKGRAGNFIYGSAKAGFDRFLEGLQHKHDGSAVRIIRVKPGLTDTPMTAGMEKGGPLWASADRVAADIERAVSKGRRVAYAPWFWWVIMTIIRHLPWFVFRRLKI
jgi:decaprenylphospho-beta-D-erythro-pentofuranosid-2-ulose 2-reductase